MWEAFHLEVISSASTEDELYRKIKSCIVAFPEGISIDFIDLLEKMFKEDPDERLTAAELLMEPFFAPFQDSSPKHLLKDSEAQDHLRTTARSKEVGESLGQSIDG